MLQIYKTASYIVVSIMELNEYKDAETMKNYLVKYLCDMHFENKNLIKNFKIIEFCKNQLQICSQRK